MYVIARRNVADIPVGTFELLLQEDGIQLPTTGGAEKPIRCFLPNHGGHDKTPSASVNVVKGTFYCHKCDIGLNAVTYLKEMRGLANEDISKELGQQGWDDRRIQAAQDKQREYEQHRQGRPKWTDKTWASLKGRAQIASHDYLAADGTLVCRLIRYKKKPEEKGPKCLPFTPASQEGGWWSCGPLSEELPPEDSRCTRIPLYRLPEMLEKLKANPGRQIWIVEGEKCVDAVLGIQDMRKKDGTPSEMGPPPCTTGMFGFNPDRIDFSPLEGQKILLMSDQDDAGHAKMLKLAAHLAGKLGCAVKTLLPPGEAEPRFKGFDIADALAEGGWPGALKWIGEVGGPKTYQFKERSKTDIPNLDPMDESDYFKVLGLSGQDHIAVQSKATHEVHLLPRKSLFREGSLIILAPLHFWMNQSGGQGFGTTPRLSFADSMLRAAEGKGHVNVREDTVSRGAARKDKTVIFNVGDKVLFPGPDGRLSEPRSFDQAEGLYQPGPTIPLHDDPNAPMWARSLYDAIISYRFMSLIDARAFSGWIVSSIVGGALDFRPMVWLLAPPSTGKTYLLERVLTPVLYGLVLPMAETTDAGLMTAMASDSLPCYLDEFEPSKGDEQKWTKILDLIRVATGGGGSRLRGTAGNTLVVMHQPRFSILVASTMRMVLSTANESRYFTIRLANNPVDNWPKVRRAIEDSTETKKTAAIRTLIIRNAPAIIDKAKELEDALSVEQSKLGTREIMMIAALTAGAGFLSGDYDYVMRRVGTKDDTYTILNQLLSSLIRTPDGDNLSLAEVLRVGYWSDSGTFHPRGFVTPLANLAARYGFKMGGPSALWVGTNIEAQSALLRHTASANIDIDDYFRRLPGSERLETSKGAARRIRFADMQRHAYVIGEEALEAAGFSPSKTLIADDDPVPPHGYGDGGNDQQQAFQTDDEVPF